MRRLPKVMNQLIKYVAYTSNFDKKFLETIISSV